jgi:hypothetical protein
MTLLRFKRKLYRLWLLQLVVWSDMGRSQEWYDDGELGPCPSRDSDKSIFKINQQLKQINSTLREINYKITNKSS